jgi:hypothetical protein
MWCGGAHPETQPDASRSGSHTGPAHREGTASSIDQARADSSSTPVELASYTRRVQNKIVARYADGRVLKGNTADFSPLKSTFHVVPTPQAGSSIAVVEIKVADLKALFFVKDFEGDASYNEVKTFASGVPQGRKIEVLFRDGEVLVGTTMGYHADRPGFFLLPADPHSNNDRCFVVAAAVRAVKFL